MRARTLVSCILIAVVLVLCGIVLALSFVVFNESTAPFLVERALAPTLLVLCLSAGSFLLWRRTPCLAALTQLVASGILVLTTLSEDVRTATMPGAQSWLPHVVWSQPLLDLTFGVHHVCVAGFGIGYVWYAATRKRI